MTGQRDLAENEGVLHRVQRDRLAIMYVKLMRGPEFVGAEYGGVLERFEKIARRVGVTHLREGGRDLDEKLDNWKGQWRDWLAKEGWYNSLKPKGQAGDELTLTENGKSDYSILISKEGRSVDEKAAETLQKWLKEMTGAKLAIVIEGSRVKDKSKIISIGRTNKFTKAKIETADEDLGQDGWGIGTCGEKLYLWGGSVRGPIAAVFALLEEDLGCRWYTDEHFRIPKVNTLRFRPVARAHKPPMELRDPFYFVSFNWKWAIRNRTNPPFVPDVRVPVSEEVARIPDEWGGSTDCSVLWVHTFSKLLPPSEYYDEHPEYYMLNGNGNRSAQQLCTTNTDVIRIATEKLKEILKSNPNVRLVSISKQDGGGTCLCENCRALDEPEGSNMAALLSLVNGVADGIEDEFPEVVISTLAYLETVRVPKTVRPRQNVAIRLCNDDVGSWVHPFAPAEQCEIANITKRWAAAHDRIYIWDYVTNFSHYMSPMPNMEVVAKNIRFFAEHNVKGMMTQAAFQSTGGEREWMRSWVEAKLMLDPSRDVFEMMHDFIYGHYGESAEMIAAYNKLLQDQGRKYAKELSGDGLRELGYDGLRYGMDHPFLSKEFLAKASGYFDKAEELATNKAALHRVEEARLPIMYVKLMRGPEFVGYEYGAVLEKFKRIVRRIDVKFLYEASYPHLEDFLNDWKEKWDKYLIEQTTEDMKVVFAGANSHMIEHTIKVHDYAMQIQQAHGGDRVVVNTAALLHDIGIPQAREVHGSAAGKFQEIEGPIIAKEILAKYGIAEDKVEHICGIIANHHSAADEDIVSTVEFKAVWDGDWLVNFSPEGRESVEKDIEEIFMTEKDKEIARGLFL